MFGSPQVQEATKRAFWLAVAALVPLLIDYTAEVSLYVTGPAVILLVFGRRVLEGLGDAARAKNLEIRASDVGSNLVDQYIVTEPIGTVTVPVNTGPTGIGGRVNTTPVVPVDATDELDPSTD